MTRAPRLGTLGFMAWTEQRLDPERSRRRLQLLAELAGAKAVRARERPRRLRYDQLRELIDTRRRRAG
ncbi:hypothetical protein AB0J86_27695 [Micromonospora sp. NPDC049559]|uniref:hypothetical protein n=1 Tax=Micromonospora sp. NPDC049559 TaxID=3155923 RepID=UPI003422AADF